MTPLGILELRNSFNLAVVRKKITKPEVDLLWEHFEAMLAEGVFVEMSPSTTALHQKARELSDRYTPNLATRSLDLLHVAAAILLKAEAFYTFDDRQGLAAVGEGLVVVP